MSNGWYTNGWMGHANGWLSGGRGRASVSMEANHRSASARARPAAAFGLFFSP